MRRADLPDLGGFQGLVEEVLRLPGGDFPGLTWSSADPPQMTTLKAFLLFEAADRLDGLGRYDEAFTLLSEANRLKRSEPDAGRDVVAFEAHMAWLRSVFTPAFLAQHQVRNRERAPIFIVGLPRSGSTLVEQILASHPEVTGMGESDAMGRLMRKSYPLDPLGPFDLSAMAADYLDQIRAAGWSGRGRFTDKRLPTYMMIGLVHLLFPRATILHVTRESADACFANFRRLFRNSDDGRYAYDLGELGRHYRAYRSIMDHWSFVLMGRVVNVRYEALVADLPGEVRQLLAACGLPWDARCLRYWETDRQINTMSAQQVRLPIFTHGVGRWRNYERHLAPLFAALGPYAP